MESAGKVLSFQSHPEYTLDFIQKFDSICMKMTENISEEKFQNIQKISKDFDSALVIQEINKYLRGVENIFYH